MTRQRCIPVFMLFSRSWPAKSVRWTAKVEGRHYPMDSEDGRHGWPLGSKMFAPHNSNLLMTIVTILVYILVELLITSWLKTAPPRSTKIHQDPSIKNWGWGRRVAQIPHIEAPTSLAWARSSGRPQICEWSQWSYDVLWYAMASYLRIY